MKTSRDKHICINCQCLICKNLICRKNNCDFKYCIDDIDKIIDEYSSDNKED